MFVNDRIKEFYYNNFSRNVKSKGGKIYIYNKSVIDIHNTSRINLYDDFYINSNHFKDSKAEGYIRMQENSTLNVNGCFKLFYGSTIQVFKNACLTLGKGYINSNSVIACCNKITIGDGAALARGVYIYDGDHHSIIDANDEVMNRSSPIVIGNNVWIGVGAIILKGANIGEGSIIGAGSVVNKNVPPNCMVAGNPAKVMKENIKWK